uniref:Uncharacterized protein LOC111105680 n=1 Tax=Crassostrea virginica TaxID=6565 RepID=A0A8B8AYB7_CRAVI|nr:uncharacterized protein LOC111105680 [Crassostrea virginica]
MPAMSSRALQQVFVFALFFTIGECWSGRKTMPTKIWESARNKVHSTKWSLANSWNGDNVYKNKWKCNLFVYDVLQEVKASTPKRWSWWRFRWGPIGANEWANPDSRYLIRTGCYHTVKYSDRRIGDIIAFKRNRNSGHMGIVSTSGNYISAQRNQVKEDNVDSFLRRDASIVRTTVWRNVCLA